MIETTEKIVCQRCGKTVDPGKAVTQTIIYRDRIKVYDSWRKSYVSKAVNKSYQGRFCSAECAINEQMANEG